MAETTAIKICPECGSVLPKEDSGFCPSCHIQLKDPKTVLLKLPKYLSTQLSEFTSIVEKGLSDHLEVAMKEPGAEREEVEKKFVESALGNMDSEYERVMIGAKAIDKVACAQDTYEFLKVSISSKMTGDERRSFISVCKGIGQLAESIDKYIHAGGQCYGGATTPKLGDGERDTGTTG